MNVRSIRSVAGVIAAVALVTGFWSTAVAHTTHAGKADRLKAALRNDLDSYLNKRSAAEHLSSLSLAVDLGGGRPVLLVRSGTRQLRSGAAVAPNDLYQIGSNTKAFTAVAVLQLEAQGRLSIDAPIGTYLPQYAAWKNVTLRQLLSMTGGLESYDNLPIWYRTYVRHPKERVSADSLIRMVYPARKFPPGSTYAYSNTGYLIAQEVVAKLSASRSFDKEIARIIASAGLRDTFYTSHLYAPAIARRVVAGYYENDDPGFTSLLGHDVSRDSLSWAQGAGSIVSTPADLAAWARALYQGTSLLPPAQKRELLRLVSTKSAKPLATPTQSDPAGFGLGVARRFDPKLGAFWFYQGETLGFRAAHLYFPDRNLVVTLFANSRPVEAESKLQSLFGQIDQSIRANPI